MHQRRILAAAASTLVVLLTAGCGGYSGPPRVAIHGAILFQHEPLKSGRITFIPTDGSKGPAAVATVSDGFYDFNTRTGPIVGKHKVQIEAIVDPGFELDDEAAYAKSVQQHQVSAVAQQPVPAEFNLRTTLTATVSTDGDRKLDFSL